LAKAVKRPALLPVPAAALTLLLGEAATLIVEGQRVIPHKTMLVGFQFTYPDIDAALAQVLS
jgi:hypothetical protein